MIVNFRARGISRGTRKLAWTSILIKKNTRISNTILVKFDSKIDSEKKSRSLNEL
jgi:hypothetical protein